jgi:hypothetical protein
MIDLLRLTPEQQERFMHLQAIVERQASESARVRALRDYYDGEHPVKLTQRQQEFIGSLLSEGEFEFSHNLVKSVIDTLRERLSVSGFTVNGAGLEDAEAEEGAPANAPAALFWDWWKANRMDARQIDLYRNVLRDGKGYVMVDWDADKQQPRLIIHLADNGTTGVRVHRDPEDSEHILFVNRYWYTYDPLQPGHTGIERKTTYLPGEIRKYQRRGANDMSGDKSLPWVRVQDPGDPAWPLPWVDRLGKPLGITIIEFANPGGSEIAQIIGLQDAVNKSWLDLIAAADTSGFPMLFIEYERDAAFNSAIADDDDLEDSDEFRIGPGRAIELDGAHANRIEGANLMQMLEVVWALVAAISGVTRTPQYYLRPVGGADVPSGEALKQLESGLVKRAQERHLVFGQAWEDVFALAYRVASTFGAALPDEELNIETEWDDAEVRNEMVQVQRGEGWKRLEVPNSAIWKMLGFTPDEIAAWDTEKQMQAATQLASIAQALTAQTQRNGAQSGSTAAQSAPQQNGGNVEQG